MKMVVRSKDYNNRGKYHHSGVLVESEGEPQLREPQKCDEWRFFSIKDIKEGLVEIFPPHTLEIGEFIELLEKEEDVGKIEGFPKRVDLNITEVCNLKCSYCWGINRGFTPREHKKNEIETEDWRGIIWKLKKAGCEKIVFTGGEPLTRSDIGELVQFAKELGLKITLSTNATFLRKKRLDVLPYIDEIGIPVDGADEETSFSMRPSVSGRIYPFKAAIDAFSLVKEVNPNIEITIRTVVSKQSLGEVLKIGDLLNKIRNRFDRWKLYPFTPAANVPPKARERFKIKSEEFVRVVDQASKLYPGIKIDKYNPIERKGRYIFIGDDGAVFTIDEKENILQLGNFLKENGQLLKQMANHTIPDRNIKS